MYILKKVFLLFISKINIYVMEYVVCISHKYGVCMYLNIITLFTANCRRNENIRLVASGICK